MKAGDPLQKGQKLFSVDDRELQGNLGVKKAALKAMEARLHTLEQAPHTEEIPPSVAKVEEAKAQLGDAEVQVKLIGKRDGCQRGQSRGRAAPAAQHGSRESASRARG